MILLTFSLLLLGEDGNLPPDISPPTIRVSFGEFTVNVAALTDDLPLGVNKTGVILILAFLISSRPRMRQT